MVTRHGPAGFRKGYVPATPGFKGQKQDNVRTVEGGAYPRPRAEKSLRFSARESHRPARYPFHLLLSGAPGRGPVEAPSRPPNANPPTTNHCWIPVKDGDDRARAIFDRHYSRIHYKDGRKPKTFVGPGYKMVLLLSDCQALFVWRKFIDPSGQQGVCCAVFRNESNRLSSELIQEAVTLAWQRWPGHRLYTYVNPNRITSTNPGYCFLKAGWRKCGRTKGGLLVLEKLPPQEL